MSNWNSILSRDNSKILGIINLSNDSFTGDSVFNHDEGLKKLLQSAKQNDINFIDIGCASSKPRFDSVTTEEEIERLETIRLNALECGLDDLIYEPNLKKIYPFLNVKNSIFSPSSGIFDSHEYFKAWKEIFVTQKDWFSLGMSA